MKITNMRNHKPLEEKNLVKVEKENLEGMSLKGNFLCEEKGAEIFAKKFTHSIFVQDNDVEGKKASFNFDKYVTKFMNICAKSKNKPSLLFLNYLPKNLLASLNGTKKNYKANYELVEVESKNYAEQLKLFSQKPCAAYVGADFSKVLKALVETRSEITPKNEILVFFNEPENAHNLKNPKLEEVLTVAGSRKIRFVLNMRDENKFNKLNGKGAFEAVEGACLTKFVCNEKGVQEIELFC